MKGTTTKKSLRMEVALIRKIEKLAEKENRNFTNMVNTILKREVDNRSNRGSVKVMKI